MNELAQLTHGALNCVRFGNVKAGEHVLILAEPGADDAVIEAISIAAKGAGGVVSVLVKEPTPIGVPLAPPVAAAIQAADLVYDLGFPTVHSEAGFLAAFDHGTRNLIVRPEAGVLASEAARFPLEIFFLLGKRTQARIRKQPSVHVVDDKGTDFHIEAVPGAVGPYIGPLPYEPGPAVPGYIGTFPPGTTVWGDLNCSANGTLVLDAAFSFEAPGESIVWKVKDGWIVEIDGGREAAAIREAIHGRPNANRFAECGFGLNPKVSLAPGTAQSVAARVSTVLSWTRRAGTFFVGMGGNTLMGGRDASTVVPIYGVLKRPTVAAGAEVLIDAGRLTMLDMPDDELVSLSNKAGGKEWLEPMNR